MNEWEREFLIKAEAEALRAKHPWPKMAACEAALESGYGRSGLAVDDNNLFGMKLHSHNLFGQATLPTREFENGQWKACIATWEKYPDWGACFADRYHTLMRLASVMPHYARALTAKDAVTYVQEVSKSWSTDPDRAKKVIVIYHLWMAEDDLRMSGAD